jgi:hypothetical protein
MFQVLHEAPATFGITVPIEEQNGKDPRKEEEVRGEEQEKHERKETQPHAKRSVAADA